LGVAYGCEQGNVFTEMAREVVDRLATPTPAEMPNIDAVLTGQSVAGRDTGGESDVSKNSSEGDVGRGRRVVSAPLLDSTSVYLPEVSDLVLR